LGDAGRVEKKKKKVVGWAANDGNNRVVSGVSSGMMERVTREVMKWTTSEAM
jgi:hypothetical protein